MTPHRHSAAASHALQALAEADPALAALSLWCQHKDGAQTTTTRDVITYGTDFAALPLHEQIGVAAHHILHVALRHPARLDALQIRLGTGFDPALYNLVADAVVNETLLLADYALPRPAVLLTTLVKETLNQDLSPIEALADWDVDRLYFALATQASEAGSQNDGTSRYAKDHSFAPDLEPSAGKGGQDDVEQAARWRQHMTRAMDAGRQAGRGIGRFGHRIADIPQPTTPWELVLRRLLLQAIMVYPQPSHLRPARRWIATAAHAAQTNAPTPGFEAGQRPTTAIPRIAVALDASGSIDDARLALFWGEITGIARRMRAEIQLMVFDDDIRHHAKVDPAQHTIPVPDLPRGGGTDFVPVIQAAMRMKASALVVLTDLDGETGPAPRGLPVIWAVPDGIVTKAAFGRVISLAA